MWLDNRGTRDRGGMECCISSWEECVAETEGLHDNFFVRIVEEVGFAATGVDVGVAAVKGVEGPGLVPAR